MAERLSLDDLDEVLIEKLKGRKDEELQTSTTGSADSDSALGRALQEIPRHGHGDDDDDDDDDDGGGDGGGGGAGEFALFALQRAAGKTRRMELLQRLAFDDLPVPDIPEPPEMEQYSFSRNVSPTDAECEFPVAARDTNKTVASQLLSTYTEDDRQRRDTAHMVNSSQTRRRFSRVSKSPKAGGDSRSCCFWTWIQHLVAHPGFEMLPAKPGLALLGGQFVWGG
ncbi:hypothetical protein AK812_SmicGene38131, partial [Symbiodinium microadriaticum]